jgi:hypothetical protein
MSHERYDVSTLGQFVGQELGVSPWLTVDQERINESIPQRKGEIAC